MSQQSVLSRVTIGYSPVIDRQRNVVATRLTLFPERPQAEIDGASLVDALLTAFPEGPKHSLKLPGGAAVSVLVNPAGEALLMGLLAAPRPARLMRWPWRAGRSARRRSAAVASRASRRNCRWSWS
jgi:EAL and modified HD-GYP domain-containing signal transduction protein